MTTSQKHKKTTKFIIKKKDGSKVKKGSLVEKIIKSFEKYLGL